MDRRESQTMQGVSEKADGLPPVGCSDCSPFGGRGYVFERPSGRENPIGRVVVCGCVARTCTCGALRPQERVPGPPYGELADRTASATDEPECVCWPVRRRVALVNRMLAESAIGGLYRGKLLDDYRTMTPQGQVIEEAERARGQASTWLEDIVRGKNAMSLYLYGPPGDGKTLLACALLSELIVRAGRQGLYVHLSRDYFQRLRNTYDDQVAYAETTEQVFSRLTNVPYLVLDDLGVERGSTWEVEWLYNLVDARYQNSRPFIVTANQSFDDLRELSHGRIASRLRHMCVGVKLPEADLRQYFDYGA